MEIRIFSIKEAKEYLKNKNVSNIRVIIISSYENDIESIASKNKIVLNFDDINTLSTTSFNENLAKKISKFVYETDFKNYTLYICCDSGVSRSSAVAAAILRKYKEDEKKIWKDYDYSPNLLVYKILCDEFKLKNSKIRIRYLDYLNKKALKRQINKSNSIFNILKKIERTKYVVDKYTIK